MLNIRGIGGKEPGLAQFAQQRSLSVLGLTETWACSVPSALRDHFRGWSVHDQPAVHGTVRGCGGVVLLHDSSWSGTKLDAVSVGEDVLAVRLERGAMKFVAVVFYNRTERSRTRLEATLLSLEGEDVLVMGDFNLHISMQNGVPIGRSSIDDWLVSLTNDLRLEVAVGSDGLLEYTWYRTVDHEVGTTIDYILHRSEDGIFDDATQEVVDVRGVVTTDHQALVFGPLIIANSVEQVRSSRSTRLPTVVPCYLDPVWSVYRRLLRARLASGRTLSLQELTQLVADAYRCVPSFKYAAVLQDLDGTSQVIAVQEQRREHTAAVIALAEAADAVTQKLCRRRVDRAVSVLEHVHAQGYLQRCSSIRWELQQLIKAEQRKPLFSYIATLVDRISPPARSIPTTYAITEDGKRVLGASHVLAVWKEAHAKLLCGPQPSFERRPSATSKIWWCDGHAVFATVMQMRRNRAKDFQGLAGEAFINAIPPTRLRPDGWIVNPSVGELDGPNYWPGKELFVLLAKEFNNVTFSGAIPAEWLKTSVSFIYKGKDDPGNPANSRGISMIHIMSKVYRTFMARTLRDWMEQHKRVHFAQRSFRKRKGVEDNAFMVVQLDYLLYSRPRKSRKSLFGSRKKLVLVMVDQKKAYDSVPHEQLFAELRRKGLDEAIVAVLAAFYSGTELSVRLGGRESESFPMRRGLAQGAPESPVLYNLYINQVLEKLYEEFAKHPDVPRIPADDGRPSKGVPALMYADDLLLLGLSTKVCQQMLDFFRDQCLKLGLELNISKTEAVILHTAKENWPAPLTAMDKHGIRHAVEWKESVRYLGLFMDSQMTLQHHVSIIESRMLVKERMLWKSGLLSGDRVKLSIARDYAANQIFSHAEFLATIMPVEQSWKAVEDQQVRIARALLHLPRTSNRVKTMVQIGWVWITHRLRWFRIKWLLRCRDLPADDYWHQLMDVLCRNWKAGGFAAKLRRDCSAIGKPQLFERDGVSRYIATWGRGGLACAVIKLKEVWRHHADRCMLHSVQFESLDSAARWHGLVLHTPAAVPFALQREFSSPAQRVTFQSCHDTLWSRPGNRLRAKMQTDCYAVGSRLLRLMATYRKVREDDMDSFWALCPFCKQEDIECTTTHLLVTCRSAALTAIRQDMQQRVRNVSDPFLRTTTVRKGGGASGEDMEFVVGLLTPSTHVQRDTDAEDARVAGWIRIILGGRTALPVLTGDQARVWAYYVPQDLPNNRKIVQVDLSSNWDDIMWRERRRDIVKIRFDTHVITAQYLMVLDRLYHQAMDAWLLGPGEQRYW